MKKVLLTATVQSHICQFHIPLINILKEEGYEVHVAARNNLKEKNGLKLVNVDKVFDIPFERSPYKRNNILAWKKLREVIKENQYEVIHCNTPMGGIITRLAAKSSRKQDSKIIYSAHGFHFYKGAPKINWLVYYPIEKIMARFTDILITICEEDYLNAKNKKFKTDIRHIHGVGANTNKYNLITEDEKLALRDELGYNKSDFMVICTGELNSNKNQITVLRAIPELLTLIPNFRLLVAGNGPMEKELKNECKKLNIENNVNFLGYRADLERFVKASDIVISVSIREGLGLNLIEGMLCGKPIIASVNRGHKELVDDKKNGYLIDKYSYNNLSARIYEMYKDPEMMLIMGKEANKKAYVYTDTNVINELKEIYNIKVEDL